MIAFIDASFLIALYHQKDDFHPKAKKVVKKLEKKPFKPITSNVVVAEAVNFIFRNNGPKLAKGLLDSIKKSPLKEIFLSEEIFNKGYKLLFKQKTKRGLNLFDCLHLATMKALGIETILTFDKRFKREVKVIS